MHNKISLAQPDLAGNELLYVSEAIRSSWVSSSGKYIDRFEREFAQICGTRTSISVSNGTAALHLAMLTLGVSPGDEVIVPSLTYIATANAVRYVGAIPVFVDIQPDTWCIDPDRVRQAITPKTKGIIAVHLYGHPADMDALNAIAIEHDLWVVEDAAEAPCARYKGRPVGSLSQLATFSFYGNKVFTSGEGGALTLSDDTLETRARLLRGQGMDPNRRYYFPIVGYNFRLTNVACAMLCAQIERRERLLARRREIYALYVSQLENCPCIGMQPCATWAEISPWLFSITIKADSYRTRDEIMRSMSDRGIETRPFFVPLHTLPPYQDASRARSMSLDETMKIASSGMNLPTYSQMSDTDVSNVCRTLLEICQ